MEDFYKINICGLKKQLETEQSINIEAYELKIVNIEPPLFLTSFKVIEFINSERTIYRDFLFVLNDIEKMEVIEMEVEDFAIDCLCKIPIQTNQNKNFQMRLVKITDKVPFEVISTHSFETVCSLRNIKHTTCSAKEIDSIECI